MQTYEIKIKYFFFKEKKNNDKKERAYLSFSNQCTDNNIIQK